ncbi:unnamed protein product [Paramecium primaurelia]|uniref:Uncharacterized protein n=1 Tax=Paramecium primaurelia TaxID=5886 RepID=A0A8S1NSB6_PARPR|nr:unnamed protein product [Paramecium primaurelia]
MQSVKTEPILKSKDKQKKLLIKKIMIWARQGFNSRNIGFHPFLFCASIKPGAQTRHTTLQSYPNAELWKSMSKLSQSGIIQEIQMEILFKLDQVKRNYDSQIIEEFKFRVNNHFDFAFLYKESEQKCVEKNDQYDIPNVQNINHPNLKERDESESKSLAKQVDLCNSRKGSIAKFEKSHYHKLCQFLEKVKHYLDQSSLELRQFYQGVQLFLESQQISTQKKMKIEQVEKVELQEEKQECYLQQNKDDQQQQQNQKLQQLMQQNNQSQSQLNMKSIKNKYQILDEIKLDALTLQPGLAFFLPNYSKMVPEEIEKVKEIEKNFLKELYSFKILHPQEYTPKYILLLWRTQFEPQYKKPTNILPICQQDIIKKE